jgi:hypothetical protein
MIMEGFVWLLAPIECNDVSPSLLLLLLHYLLLLQCTWHDNLQEDFARNLLDLGIAGNGLDVKISWSL